MKSAITYELLHVDKNSGARRGIVHMETYKHQFLCL